MSKFPKNPATTSKDVAARLISGREGGLLLIFILIASLICGRLFMLTVVDAQALSAEGQQKRTTEFTLTAQRGKIIDRNGNVLASSVEATTIYANPSEVENPRETAGILHDILGGSIQEYMEALTLDKDSTFVYIAKKADTGTAQKLQDKNQEYIDSEIKAFREAGSDIPAVIKTPLFGIHYLDDSKRQYPYGHIGAQIIGAVDDENLGVSGLELTYDSILRGIDGKLVLEKGKAMSQGQQALPMIGGVEEQVLAVDGQDIIISLDIELQQYVEYNLKALAEQRSCNNANTLLLDGSTGEILAAASIPLYDRTKISQADAQNGATTLKSITEAYEPGSTFKALIAGLALENQTMQPDDIIYCPNSLDIYDYTITDFNKERPAQNMSLRDIMAQSSNVGVSLMEQKIGDEAFCQFLEAAGLGMPTHVDYPGETQGALDKVENWNPVQAANISFGQGVQVSSLQLASYYGAIANDGVMVQPHFLIARPQYDTPQTYDSRRIIKTSTARVLEELLRGVVTDGTGQAAALEGFDVVGKTGTAEKPSEDGGYLSSEYIQSFVGYIDNSNSNIVCISAFDNAMGNPAPSSVFFPIVMNFVASRYMIAPQAEAEPIDEDAATVNTDNSEILNPSATFDAETQETATLSDDTATSTRKSQLTKPQYQVWSIDTSG